MITNKDKLFAVLTVILILSFAWGAYMVPKQIKFINKCEESCSELGWELHETTFLSYPINNLNGKCFCKNRREFLFGGKDE